MNNRYVFITIAKYTFFEAVRDRLFILLIVGLVCAFGLSQFIGELAITETQQIQVALLGSGLRLFAIFTIGLFVVTSMVREFNDKGLELLLSNPIPRASYYLGKLSGFSLICFVLVFLIGLEIAVYTPINISIIWSISLLCEIFIIITLSILCLITFSNITIAFSLVFLFYLLARNIEAIQLISRSPILETNTISQDLINTVIDCIAYLLPNFNSFTKTEWLVYHNVTYNDLLIIMGQTLIYTIFISGAALFDG